jgi:hypothetical protein
MRCPVNESDEEAVFFIIGLIYITATSDSYIHTQFHRREEP